MRYSERIDFPSISELAEDQFELDELYRYLTNKNSVDPPFDPCPWDDLDPPEYPYF